MLTHSAIATTAYSQLTVSTSVECRKELWGICSVSPCHDWDLNSQRLSYRVSALSTWPQHLKEKRKTKLSELKHNELPKVPVACKEGCQKRNFSIHVKDILKLLMLWAAFNSTLSSQLTVMARSVIPSIQSVHVSTNICFCLSV